MAHKKTGAHQPHTKKNPHDFRVHFLKNGHPTHIIIVSARKPETAKESAWTELATKLEQPILTLKQQYSLSFAD